MSSIPIRSNCHVRKAGNGRRWIARTVICGLLVLFVDPITCCPSS